MLEKKRSQLKSQALNELSLRDKALESHASLVKSLYQDARARLQHTPAKLLLQLPPVFISDAFEQDVAAITKASDKLQSLKSSPVAIFGAITHIAPSLAVQDAVFVAVSHAGISGSSNELPALVTHFHKIKWLFERFSEGANSSLPSFISKPKFVECLQRIGCSSAAGALEQLYDALTGAGIMSFLHFCCAFLPPASQAHMGDITGVQSIILFNERDNAFHPTHISGIDAATAFASQVDTDHEQLQSNHSQVLSLSSLLLYIERGGNVDHPCR